MISSLYHAVAEAWCFIKSNCNSSLDAVQIDVIHHEPHTLSLMPFKFFFQQSFIDFYICEVVSFYWAEQGIKLDCFASKIYYGNWKFYMKRNKKMQSNKLSRVGSTDWKSSLRSVSTPPWMRCLCIVRLPLLPHTPPLFAHIHSYSCLCPAGWREAALHEACLTYRRCYMSWFLKPIFSTYF